MRAIPQADRAHEQQHGHPAEIATEELLAGEREDAEREREQETRREPRRVVLGQEARGQLAVTVASAYTSGGRSTNGSPARFGVT